MKKVGHIAKPLSTKKKTSIGESHRTHNNSKHGRRKTRFKRGQGRPL